MMTLEASGFDIEVSYDGESIMEIEYEGEIYNVEIQQENVRVTKGHQEVTLTLQKCIEIFISNVGKMFHHDDEQE